MGSILTEDGRCTCEIKSRIAMAKVAFNSKLDLNLRKKRVKCYVWSMALYGAETWTLRATDQKRWKVLKCGDGDQLDRSCEK